jgi:hypothetical protein
MLLIIQIAAGIVLGFAIIAYRTALFKSAKWIAFAAFALVILGLVIWGASEAVSAIKPYTGKIFSTGGMIIFMIPVFAFGAAGSWGLWELLLIVLRREKKLVLRREKKPRSDDFELIFYIFMGFINAMIVTLFTWPLLSYTVAGRWYGQIDNWSRANGFADGGAIAVASIFWLWPYLPLALIWKRRMRVGATQTDGEKLDTQFES